MEKIKHLAKKGLVGALATTMLASPLTATGKEGGLRELLKFGAGALTQVEVHEAGHYLGAKVSGTKIEENGRGKWSFSGNPSNGQRLGTSLGGYALP
jgi:hypothetical protein